MDKSICIFFGKGQILEHCEICYIIILLVDGSSSDNLFVSIHILIPTSEHLSVMLVCLNGTIGCHAPRGHFHLFISVTHTGPCDPFTRTLILVPTMKLVTHSTANLYFPQLAARSGP